MMIDYKTCRLGGNPYGNLIISIAFYVVELQKIGDDKAFLKGCLWPQLYKLHGCKDIEYFWKHYLESVLDSRIEILNVCEIGATSTTTNTMEGEGVYGP